MRIIPADDFSANKAEMLRRLVRGLQDFRFHSY